MVEISLDVQNFGNSIACLIAYRKELKWSWLLVFFFSILWEDLVYLAALTFPQFYSRMFRVCFFPTLKQNKILFSVHYFALIGKKPVIFFFQNKQSKNQKSMYIDENVSYTWCKPLVGTIVRVSCAFIVSFSLVLEREYALFFFVDSFSIYVVGFAYTRGC